jgi:hypothetical protein
MGLYREELAREAEIAAGRPKNPPTRADRSQPAHPGLIDSRFFYRIIEARQILMA